VENLDIYNKVGRGVAHDEIIPFSVRGGQLKVNGETSKINGKISVEFLKVSKVLFSGECLFSGQAQHIAESRKVSFSDCPLFVCLSVNFSHFLPLQNHCAKFD
jgi:hypothetical protein